MMSVFGDDGDEIEDEAPLPAAEPDMSGPDVLHYRWGGPFGQSEESS